jgi:hypothetical protein
MTPTKRAKFLLKNQKRACIASITRGTTYGLASSNMQATPLKSLKRQVDK